MHSKTHALPHFMSQKCKDTGFCRRNRGVAGPPFAVVPNSIATGASGLTAKLRNEKDGAEFDLSLKAYSDGFVRLMVDENAVDRCCSAHGMQWP